MSLSIGELVGYVTLDTSGVRREAANAKRQVSALGREMRDSLNGTRTITGGVLGTALKGLSVGLIGAGVAGGIMGVKTAAGLEQAHIAFSTMLGSGKKADVFLRKLNAFAAATPFDFPGLVDASSSLISAGINANKVIPIMTTLGDVTSGMGTGAEGIKRATIAIQQMNAAGAIHAEDLNQLRDAGIPVYDLLSAALGKTKAQVVQLAQDGKLGHDALAKMMKALETGKGLERFSGLMEKQSHSLTGMWSTFTDTLNMKLAKAMGPLIPMLKQGLGAATNVIATALPKVTAALMAVLAAGIKVTKWLQDHSTVTKVVVGALVVAMSLWAAAATAAAISNVVAWVTTATASAEAGAKMELTVAQMAFRWVWMAGKALASAARMALSWIIAMGPIALVIAAVVGLTVLVVKNWDKIKAWTIKAWHAIASFVTGAVSKVVDWVRGHWPLLLAIITGPIGIAVLLIVKHWGQIKAATVAAWNAVSGWVRNAWGWITGHVSAGVARAKAFVGNAWQWVRGRTEAVWGAIAGAVRWYVGRVHGAISALASIPGRIGAWFGRARDAAVGRLGSLLGFVRGLPGRIVGALAGIGSRMWSVGTNVVTGIMSGIRSMGGWLVGQISGWVSAHIPGPIKKALGIASPSRVMAEQVGRWIPAGIAQGITAHSHLVSAAAVNMAQLAVTGGRGMAVPSYAGARASVVERTHTIVERQGPLIGSVQQQPGESADTLAERLWFKTRTRG